MPRPLKVFLSYRQRDFREASELQHEFALRGIRLWRDVNDLPLGGSTIPEIRRGLRTDSDAFVLYMTRRIFDSEVIWGTEVPEALRRATHERRAGRLYPVVPLLRRPVGVADMTKQAVARRVAELDQKNAEFVPQRGASASVPNRRRAYAKAARRLMRSLLLRRPTGRVGVALRSFDAPEMPRGLFDLDWTATVDGATRVMWDGVLQPALRDFRHELAHARRWDLDVFVKARLPAALAFGMQFPLASGFRIRARDRQGVWSGATGPAVLTRSPDQGERRHRRVVLEVSLAQDGGAAVRALAARLHARHVRLVPPGGEPSRQYDPRPVAGRIANQIGDIARMLRRDGMADLDVVFIGPAALALLIGQQLHAVGRVHTYHHGPRGLVRAFTFAS